MADTPSSRRVGVSGDVEVSAYLEIAREKQGEAPSSAAAAGAAPARDRRRHRLRLAVLDADRPPRARVPRLLRAGAARRAAGRRSRSCKPRGVILSGGPASVYEHGAPTMPDLGLRERAARAGHLLRHAALAHQLGGKVVAVGPPRVRPRRRSTRATSSRRSSTACRRRCRSGCRTATASRSCRPASSRSPTPTTRRSPR